MLLHCPDSRPTTGPSGQAVSRTDPVRTTSPLRTLRVLALLLAIASGGGSAAAAIPADTPVAGSEGPVAEPTLPTEPGQRRAVFVCRDGGVPVFSDRPCGSARAPRTLAVDAPTSGAVPSTVAPRPRASTRPRPQPAGRSGPGRAAETRCSTLERQLDDLDDRMRAGYTSREAAQLWNRWRELKSRLRTERC
jgi:hypothetical protein